MKDIANKTGLGLATVSKYFNGGTLKENNRLAIEKIVEQDGYTINQLARSLKTKRTRTIGIVIPKFSCVFSVAVITVIQEHFRNNSYGVIVSEGGDNAKQEKTAVEFLISKMVDGIICMSIDPTGKSLLPAIQRKIPVVLFDRYIEPLKKVVDTVLIDNKAAAEEAVSLLLQNGHKNIGVLIGPDDTYTALERKQAVIDTLKINNIEVNPDYFVYGDYDIASGYRSTKQLLADHPELTAIFALNYDMTLGMIMALNELDISFPNDISIIGFDNFQFSDVIKPRITVMSQPIEKIGKKTVELMLERLQNSEEGDQTKTTVTLYPSVCHGKSIANIL